ncbi:MAG: Stage sporulation protein [Planctomycetota bacterium]|jgi:DNA segregation ATPase FtsK/SpoIIIE-like protein
MGRTKSAKSKADKEATSASPRGGALKSFLFGGELEDGARARLREIAGILSLGFALFLFVALASYRTPYADPNSAGWNWCGQVGCYVAHIVKATIGNAGFLLTFLFGAWGVVMVGGREMSFAGLRVLGSACFVLSLSFLLQHAMGPTEAQVRAYGNPHQPWGPGGWLALQTTPLLEEKFGAFGLTLVLGLVLLVSALLATEMGFSGALKSFGDWAEKRREERGEGLLSAIAGQARGTLVGLWSFLSGKSNAAPAAAAEGPRLANARLPAGDAMAESKGLFEDEERAITIDEDEDEDEERPAKRRGRKEEIDPEAIDTEWEGEAATIDEDEEEEYDDEGEPIVAEDGDEDSDDEDGEEESAASDDEHADDEQAEEELVPAAPPARKPLVAARKEAPRWDPPAPPPGEWKLPEPSMLIPPTQGGADSGNIEQQALRLEALLKKFGVEGRVESTQVGPAVTLFEVKIDEGTRLNKVSQLSNEIAAALKATSVRVQAPIPGRDTVGIEVPNQKRRVVRISELVTKDAYDPAKYALPLFIGQDTEGRAVVQDLARMPHLLIAGTTGSGKSVCINTILASLLMTRSPHDVKLILVDPKMVELQVFSKVPHLMCPVVSEAPKATAVLNWVVEKMEGRYELMKDAGVKNIKGYNALGEAGLKKALGDAFDEERTPRHLPYIVVVVDEMADLMAVSKKEAEQAITRLAQKSRAAGIHVIVATQRPSTDVITGVIKGNLPTRIAFQVASKIDSRVILDDSGADKLLGHGDMLFLPPGGAKLQRVQGALVEDSEIEQIVDFVGSVSAPSFSQELVQVASGQRPAGLVDDAADEDPMFDQAVRVILKHKRGSASLLQRALGVGYTRASRLVDMMTERGILGPHRGSKEREIMYTLEEWEKMYGAAPGMESEAAANHGAEQDEN